MYISNVKAGKGVYLMMQHITGIPRNQIFFSSLESFLQLAPPFSYLWRLATYEDKYFRLNENLMRNDNSTKSLHLAERLLN
jgi:hypothetical protein